MLKWFLEHQWEIYVVISLIVLVCMGVYNVANKVDTGRPGWPKRADLPTCPTRPSNSGGDSRGERIVRECLERRFGQPFGKARPILNPVTRQYLELDCFCPELRLAAEYNGQQHYRYTPFFHKNKEAFRNQQYRDELKRIACRENGIRLIEVPYWIPHAKIEAYINARI